MREYHLPDGEVLAPVIPVKQPEMWMAPFSPRNMDALELIIAGLHTLGAHDLAAEAQLIYVQADVMRPGHEQ